MGIRLPLQTILSFNDAGDTGSGSVAGGVPKTFILPQDVDNVVLKFTASVGGGASAVFQTTDDGGTTWFDVARTSIVTNGVPEWLSIPVISSGVNTQATFGGSILTGTIGSAAASTLGSRQASGLPVLSPTNRVFIIYTGTVTAATNGKCLVEVKANSQAKAA